MLVRLHNGVFYSIQRLVEDWLLGTLARLVFAGVLLMYFWNAGVRKLGSGFEGLFAAPDTGWPAIVGQDYLAFLSAWFEEIWARLGVLLTPSDSAYITILQSRYEEAGYDPANLTQLERIIVHMGTYGEVILPILIVVGLFTRIAAVGMIVFIAVQTYVDVAIIGLPPADVGAWFDGTATSIIWDQRSLWFFVLIVLVVKGPGPFSLDGLLGRLGRR